MPADKKRKWVSFRFLWRVQTVSLKRKKANGDTSYETRALQSRYPRRTWMRVAQKNRKLKAFLDIEFGSDGSSAAQRRHHFMIDVAIRTLSGNAPCDRKCTYMYKHIVNPEQRCCQGIMHTSRRVSMISHITVQCTKVHDKRCSA